MGKIQQAADTVISVCIAMVAIKMADKFGAFDGVKNWWKRVNYVD